MTQEEEQLLLKDLSARLPYGVIVRHADPLVDNDGNETGEFWYKRGYLCDITTLDDMTTMIIESEGSDEEGYEHICLLEKTVPYLRPMSSMTEEEFIYFMGIRGRNLRSYEIQEMISKNFSHPNGITIVNTLGRYSHNIDWLNKNMFDYRGLIPLGLAIEVTEENNPYK